MPSKFKVTIVFEAGARGWTESYIYNSSGESHSFVEGPAARLCKARVNLLGEGGRIKAYRISKEGTGPDGILRYVDLKPPVLNVPGANGELRTGPRAQPNVALLVQCSDVTESKKKFVFLRGIPDHIEVDGGKFVANLVFTNFFNAFSKELLNNPWGWTGVAVKQGPADLLNYEVTAMGIVTVTLQDNLFLAGDFGKRVICRFKNVNGTSPLNGPQIVKVIDAKQCRLIKPLALIPYRNGGQASYSSRDFIKIETASISKIVTRKAGAPLLESRGRARARARA